MLADISLGSLDMDEISVASVHNASVLPLSERLAEDNGLVPPTEPDALEVPLSTLSAGLYCCIVLLNTLLMAENKDIRNLARCCTAAALRWVFPASDKIDEIGPIICYHGKEEKQTVLITTHWGCC